MVKDIDVWLEKNLLNIPKPVIRAMKKNGVNALKDTAEPILNIYSHVYKILRFNPGFWDRNWCRYETGWVFSIRILLQCCSIPSTVLYMESFNP